MCREGGLGLNLRQIVVEEEVEILSVTKGPFLEGPEKFLHPKSRSKISYLMATELFYAHILNVTRGSLHTRSFRRIHLSVFKY